MLTEEQQETIINGVLEKFCYYLNLWWNTCDEPMTGIRDPYKPENFTVTDPKRDLYGKTEWKVLEEPDEESAFPTSLIKVDTYDGDEGGGSILYVGLDHRGISWIVHIFDLTPAYIYTADDGYRTPPDGEMKKRTD